MAKFFDTKGRSGQMHRLNYVLQKFRIKHRRVRRWVYQRHRPSATTTPVFIMGSARSGSTATMTIYDGSWDAQVVRQVDARAFTTEGVLKEHAIINPLITNSPAKVVVFKTMHDNQNARRFLERLSGLQIVWLFRNYMDCVNSCVRRWTNMRLRLKNVANGTENGDWIGVGMSDQNRRILQQHYHDDMTPESAYALFWFLRQSIFYELDLAGSARVHLFRYEDLVTEPIQEGNRMFQLSGCPFDPSLVRHLHTSSIAKYRRPSIDPGIEELCRSVQVRLIDSLHRNKIHQNVLER